MRRRVALAAAAALGLVALAIPARVPAQAPASSVAKAKGDGNQPLTVDADRMERLGKESLVIFTGNVVARQNNSVQYADRMEVYLAEKGDRVLRTVSTGGVRSITRDCRTATAARSEYIHPKQRVVLIGHARVWQHVNIVTRHN